jgi:ribosomal protein S18 acetylase RimI-like enzyme
MLHYREATVADLPSVCALGDEVNSLHHQAFPNIFAGPGRPDRDLAHWSGSISKEDSTIFVAQDGTSLVGFVTVSLARENHSLLQPTTYGRVGTIGVGSGRRGQGIGRTLMQLAQEWVRHRGGVDVRLNVWAFNAQALHMYSELGYEVRSHQLALVLPGEA